MASTLELQLQDTSGVVTAPFQSTTIEQYLLDQQYDLAAFLPEVSAGATANWPADTIIAQLTTIRQQIDQQNAAQIAADTTQSHVIVSLGRLSPEELKSITEREVRYFTMNDVSTVEYDRDITTVTTPPNPSYADLVSLISFFTQGRNAQNTLVTVSK